MFRSARAKFLRGLRRGENDSEDTLSKREMCDKMCENVGQVRLETRLICLRLCLREKKKSGEKERERELDVTKLAALNIHSHLSMNL